MTNWRSILKTTWTGGRQAEQCVRVPEDDVAVEEAGIRLPGGRSGWNLKADDAKAGVLTRHRSFSEAWFSDPARIAAVLKALELTPAEMRCEMTSAIDLLKGVVSGLKAAGWTLTSQLPRELSNSPKGRFNCPSKATPSPFAGSRPLRCSAAAGRSNRRWPGACCCCSATSEIEVKYGSDKHVQMEGCPRRGVRKHSVFGRISSPLKYSPPDALSSAAAGGDGSEPKSGGGGPNRERHRLGDASAGRSGGTLRIEAGAEGAESGSRW